MSGETRKLQKVGGGTYTVSIPKEWATEQSLSAGETVHLYPDGDGSLVVCRNDERTDAASATIPLHEDDSETIDRTLRAAYAAGVEHLTVTAESGFDDACRRLETLVRQRTGMRIVAADEDGVTVRTILDDGEVSVQRSVVQLQFVALSLFRTAVDFALGAGTADRDRIEERRTDAARLSALVTRQFGRSLSRPGTAVDLDVTRPVAFDCYRTARALDRLATLSTTVASSALATPGQPTVEALRSVAEQARREVEEATTTVVDGPTLAAVEELRATRTETSTHVAAAERTVADDPAATRLLRLLAEAATCGDRIAAVAFEAAVREKT